MRQRFLAKFSHRANREKVLLDLQVTTHSTLGPVAYETGGVLIDDGWLRLLGSGHSDLQRTLSDWNANRSDGYLLIGDDVVGGFFAINGGALGSNVGFVYYWPPVYSNGNGWSMPRTNLLTKPGVDQKTNEEFICLQGCNHISKNDARPARRL